MKSKLHLTALQISLCWESPLKNRAAIEQHLQKVDFSTDLILLPEMFTSGFTMNPEQVAESMDGPTIEWMKSWAKKLNAAIGGSLVIQEGSLYYNRFVLVTPTAELMQYDKKHTFTLSGEHHAYQTGEGLGLFEFQGWKICLRICYDLRFPVWSRNTQDYDLLLFVANWPRPRIKAWDVLLQARAIENLAYVVGVNRVGTDENGHQYPGHSAVYNPLGQCISGGLSEEESLIKAELHYLDLQHHRKHLRFLEDRDNFHLY
jgi:omega-amidase